MSSQNLLHCRSLLQISKNSEIFYFLIHNNDGFSRLSTIASFGREALAYLVSTGVSRGG